MSTVLILVCSSFITKIMCGIKSGTLKCRRRAVLMLLNLEEPFYHCSCRAFLSFLGLSWECCFEVEKLNLWSSHWSPDGTTFWGTPEACARGGKEARSCRPQEMVHVPSLRRDGDSWHETLKGRVVASVWPCRTASVTAAVKRGLWNQLVLCLKGVS